MLKLKKSILLLISGLFFINGCVNQQQTVSKRYKKLGASQEQFMKDRYECLKQSQEPVYRAYGESARGGIVAICGVWVSCLGAKGYQIDPNGNLTVPPSMSVKCK